MQVILNYVLIETGKNLDPNGENIEFKVQVFPGIFEDLELEIKSVSFLGSENPNLSINDIATYETGFISVENSGKFKVLSVTTEVLNQVLPMKILNILSLQKIIRMRQNFLFTMSQILF